MQNKIINLYKEGYSTYEIMENLNLKSKFKIYKLLKDHNLVRPVELSHTKFLKINAFENIDDEESAYWLGFLYADGCVHSHNYSFSMALHKKDKEHIYEFRTFLNSSNKVIPVKNHNTFAFYQGSKKIHEDLIRHGCIPRKSLTIKYPDFMINNTLENHFIRGIFDGDGYIYSRPGRYVVGISGTYSIVKRFDAVLTINNRIRSHNNIYDLSSSKKSFVNNTYKYLYNNATVYLIRKKLIFDEALKWSLTKTKIRSDNTSGMSGVFYNKSCKKWFVKVERNGKQKYYGYYNDISNAIKARKKCGPPLVAILSTKSDKINETLK